MRTRPTILFYAPDGAPVPAWCVTGPRSTPTPWCRSAVAEEIESIVLRGHPCVLFLDAERAVEQGLGLVRRLKGDAFTAIVPVVALAGEHKSDVVREWFSAGTDEVLTAFFSAEEQRARIEAMRARTERDVSVHPSTRLPGTTEIERDRAPATGDERGVRRVLRRPRPLQGIQRPVQLLRRRPGHLPAVPDAARRREGPAWRRAASWGTLGVTISSSSCRPPRSAWCAPRS